MAYHYLGTEEQFMHRLDDQRRDVTKFSWLARKYGGNDNNGKSALDFKGRKFLVAKEMFGSVDGWLQNFTDSVPERFRKSTLDGVGEHTFKRSDFEQEGGETGPDKNKFVGLVDKDQLEFFLGKGKE